MLSFDIFITTRFPQTEGMLGYHYIAFHLTVDTRSPGDIQVQRIDSSRMFVQLTL